jgi:hypothetical protein
LLTGFVTLDIEALVESTHKSGEFYIFTCGCGVPDCAGVSHGVIVLHSRYYIEWLIPEPLQEPYFDMDTPERSPTNIRTFRERTFEPAAYLQAVAAGLSKAQALAASTTSRPEVSPYGFTIDRLNTLTVA